MGRRTAVLLAVAAAAAVVLYWRPAFIPFRSFEFADVAGVLTTLFLLATFLERAAEVFVVGMRGERQYKLEQTLSRATDTGKAAAEDALATFKHDTQGRVFSSILIMGVLISTLGVRGLEPLLDAAKFKELPDFQEGMFEVVDVLLTGCLLAGGSDGIHKLITVFTNWFEATSKNLKKKAE